MKVFILAGGSGTRLWPLSRGHFPKQFLRFGNKYSFLQRTVQRHLISLKADDLFIITNKDYEKEVRKQLEEIIPNSFLNIIIEPSSKNTAPAIHFALDQIQLDLEEMILVAPADHLIFPEDVYWEKIAAGKEWVYKGYFVTFGIRPTKPESGFGYICVDGPFVQKFIEKPDSKTAQFLLEQGNVFWNGGLFAFTPKTFREEMALHCSNWAGKSFDELPSLSIDYALMEKSQKIVTIPLDGVSWSDVGSWENIHEILDKDEKENVILGDVVAVDTKGSTLVSNHKLVATVGLENMIVIETSDAVLVASKEKTQSIKSLVEILKNLGKKEAYFHSIMSRPWGSYEVLLEGERYKIKKIVVYPLAKLSLQMHYHRSEHWIVVKGTAKVTINSREECVHEGESIFVPKSAVHRIENPGKVQLEIIEVQVGEYLEEDDIIRLEDIYGRTKEKEAFDLIKYN